MEKVMVIGSNSFSGSDFIDLLLRETHYPVIGVSRSSEKGPLFLPYKKGADLSRFTFHRMDLNRDMDLLKDLLSLEKPGYIVNFAAQSEVAPSWEYPEQWFQTNGVAIAALGNFLKDQKWLKRYVHISSPEVYGTCESIVTESSPLNPSTPYAASKAAGDLMLFTLVKNFQFPLVMIRATNVYGAHQQLFKIIPRTVIYLKMGRKIELHGGGKAVKSYIHIRDVSRGELAAMERGRPGSIYHLSPDSGIEVRDVVGQLCDLMHFPFADFTRSVEERLGQDAAYVIDSTPARRELGWRPTVSMEEGLLGVIRWISENWAEIAEHPHGYRHKP